MTVTINGKRYEGAVAREIKKTLKGNPCEAFYITKLNGRIIAEPCKPQYLTRNKLWGAFLFFMNVDGEWVEIK